MESNIVIEDYQSSWISDFNSIRDHVWPHLAHLVEAIEHVGSTSVPGLAAKPVIDVDVIIKNAEKFPLVIGKLKSLGYSHRGNLGIEGREAFSAPADSVRQNFYVCVAGSVSLKNHLLVRDHLRSNEESRLEYGELKKKLASAFAKDIDSYIDAKTHFLLRVLAREGMSPSELRIIREANLKPLSVEKAKFTDIDEILNLIVNLSAWLKSKAILQWSSNYPREQIADDIQSGLVYVIRDFDQILATVTLAKMMYPYWSDFPGEALYLHRLAVHRSAAGKQLGARLIEWSEGEVHRQGFKILRLDCDSLNPRLRGYYESLGYQFQGTRAYAAYNMVFALFEKRVATAAS